MPVDACILADSVTCAVVELPPSAKAAFERFPRYQRGNCCKQEWYTTD
jgi:hypothetical protein